MYSFIYWIIVAFESEAVITAPLMVKPPPAVARKQAARRLPDRPALPRNRTWARTHACASVGSGRTRELRHRRHVFVRARRSLCVGDTEWRQAFFFVIERVSAFGSHAAFVCVCVLCVCVILEMPTVGEFLEEEEVSGDSKARNRRQVLLLCIETKGHFCVFVFNVFVCVCV